MGSTQSSSMNNPLDRKLMVTFIIDTSDDKIESHWSLLASQKGKTTKHYVSPDVTQ